MNPETMLALEDARMSVLSRWRSAEFDRGLFERLSAFWRPLPEALTGSALEEYAGDLEEFAWGSDDAGFANAFGVQHAIVWETLNRALMTAESRETLLEFKHALASGQMLACFAATEPGGGSSIKDMSTTLRRHRGSLVLSGRKALIALAEHADLAVVSALSDDGLQLVLVPLDSTGVERNSRPCNALRTAPVGDLTFADVRIDPSLVLTTGEQGVSELLHLVNIDRSIVWRTRVGRLRRVAELATEFGSRRKQAGKPLLDFQAYAFRVADVHASVLNGRSMMKAAARAVAHDEPEAPIIASAARLALGRASVDAGASIVHMLGGRGLEAGSWSWMYHCDSTLDSLGGGTDDIQRIMLARAAVASHQDSSSHFSDVDAEAL